MIRHALTSVKMVAAAGLFAIVGAGHALAGDQYIDTSGFAVSGYDVVAYFDKTQAPVGEAQPKATRGRSSITAEYNGATFAFSSAANREKFLADPARYAPQYDGHCAFGAAKGGKVPGDPNLWRIVDGKLYLNLQQNVAKMWEEDIPGFIEAADGNWSSGLENAPASERPVPELTEVGPL